MRPQIVPTLSLITLISLATLLLALLLPLSAGTVTLQGTKERLQQTEDAFTAITTQTRPGVVYIEVITQGTTSQESSQPANSFLNDPDINKFWGTTPGDSQPAPKQEAPSSNRGSGFIISPDGYILTNGHVIKNAAEITVTLTNKRQYSAQLIGADSRSDIGLIKIDAPDQQFTALPLGSSETLKTGQWVLAFGSPYEYIQTVTAGIVSATGRNSIGISDYEDFIQTDAAINPGNSGGPLVNIHGKVVGVITAYLTQTGGYMGLGFAVPIDMARTIAEQLMQKGKVVRGWIGLALKDAGHDDLAKQKLPDTITAARVIEVRQNSPAAETDLGPEDLIVSFNDIAIRGAADLRNRVSLAGPGTLVTLEYYRNGTRYSTSTRLGTLK
jgi:serine protease Do